VVPMAVVVRGGLILTAENLKLEQRMRDARPFGPGRTFDCSRRPVLPGR
jgi:hypothetical protein